MSSAAVCTGGDCADIGTYRVDAETSSVVLESGITNRARSVALENVKTASVGAALVRRLAPRDLVEPGQQLARTGQETAEARREAEAEPARL